MLKNLLYIQPSGFRSICLTDKGGSSEAGCKRGVSFASYRKHMRVSTMNHNSSLDLCYAIKAIEGMSGEGKDCQEQILDLHERDMKRLLCFYRKLLKENKQYFDEADTECREMLHENVAYALEYLDIYDQRVNMRRMCAAICSRGASILSGVSIRRREKYTGRLFADIFVAMQGILMRM